MLKSPKIFKLLKQKVRNRTHYAILNSGSLRGLSSVFTHLTFAEKWQLYSLVDRHHRTLVELGSYKGASSLLLAGAIRRKGGKGILYCVDTWANDAMTEGKADTMAEFTKNTLPVARHIRTIRANTVEAARKFEGKIDFLFIDADHSYDGVKADVEGWFPLLNNHALVVFHDIGWAEGVQRVVAEQVAPHATKEGRLPNLYWAWL